MFFHSKTTSVVEFAFILGGADLSSRELTATVFISERVVSPWTKRRPERVHGLNTDGCGTFREYAEKGCTPWIFGVSRFDHTRLYWCGRAAFMRSPSFTPTINLHSFQRRKPQLSHLCTARPPRTSYHRASFLGGFWFARNSRDYSL